MMDGIVLILLAGIAIWCGWMAIQNKVTYDDRQLLLKALFAHRDWSSLRIQYVSVSYQQHHWERVMSRDPFLLYDERLQACVEDYRDKDFAARHKMRNDYERSDR